MRRILTVLPVSLTVLAFTALPAAAQVTNGPEAGTRGTVGGVILALILGLIFAVVIVRSAYRGTRFGTESAHRDEAQDASDRVEHDANA